MNTEAIGESTDQRVAGEAEPLGARLFLAERPLPQVLYHYTTIDALKSIVENHALWLSSYISSNDKQECRWIDKYIGSCLANRNLDGTLRDPLWVAYAMRFRNNYMFSLSEVSDLLSQWRAYGEDGMGCAIGLVPRSIVRKESIPWLTGVDALQKGMLLEGRLHEFHPTTYGMAHVLYQDQEQRKVVEAILDEWLPQLQVSDTWEPLGFCASDLAKFALVLKHPSFAEEKEWRLLYTPYEQLIDLHGKDTFAEYNLFHDLRFRKYRGALVPYYNVKFEEFGEDPIISEVILGPRSTTLEYDVELLLRYNGMPHVVVRRSEVSYR
jgi:hypothetical protein